MFSGQWRWFLTVGLTEKLSLPASPPHGSCEVNQAEALKRDQSQSLEWSGALKLSHHCMLQMIINRINNKGVSVSSTVEEWDIILHNMWILGFRQHARRQAGPAIFASIQRDTFTASESTGSMFVLQNHFKFVLAAEMLHADALSTSHIHLLWITLQAQGKSFTLTLLRHDSHVRAPHCGFFIQNMDWGCCHDTWAHKEERPVTKNLDADL